MDRRWLGLVLVVVLSVTLTAQDPYSNTLWERNPDVPGLAGHWRAVFEQDLIAVLIVTDAHPGEIFAPQGEPFLDQVNVDRLTSLLARELDLGQPVSGSRVRKG